MKVEQISKLEFRVDGHIVQAHADGLRCWGCNVLRDTKHSRAVMRFLARKVAKGERLKPSVKESLLNQFVHLQWRADIHR